MPKRSAGLLLWRRRGERIEVLLGHPGGPFNAHRHHGAWGIFKGEYDADELPLEAARREFQEETGWLPPAGEFLALGEIRQKSGKIVTAWAVEGDADVETLSSNATVQGWPEIDRAAWVEAGEAKRWMIAGQDQLVERLEAFLKSN